MSDSYLFWNAIFIYSLALKVIILKFFINLNVCFSLKPNEIQIYCSKYFCLNAHFYLLYSIVFPPFCCLSIILGKRIFEIANSKFAGDVGGTCTMKKTFIYVSGLKIFFCQILPTLIQHHLASYVGIVICWKPVKSCPGCVRFWFGDDA